MLLSSKALHTRYHSRRFCTMYAPGVTLMFPINRVTEWHTSLPVEDLAQTLRLLVPIKYRSLSFYILIKAMMTSKQVILTTIISCWDDWKSKKCISNKQIDTLIDNTTCRSSGLEILRFDYFSPSNAELSLSTSRSKWWWQAEKAILTTIRSCRDDWKIYKIILSSFYLSETPVHGWFVRCGKFDKVRKRLALPRHFL